MRVTVTSRSLEGDCGSEAVCCPWELASPAVGKARRTVVSTSNNRLAIREPPLCVLLLGVLSGFCGGRIAQVTGGGFGVGCSVAIR